MLPDLIQQIRSVSIKPDNLWICPKPGTLTLIELAGMQDRLGDRRKA